MDDDPRPRITVIVDRDIHAAIEREARVERSTLSAICRRVLADWAAGQAHGEIP